MSTVLPITKGVVSEISTVTFLQSQSPKPARVLACVLCQQRKVKCDRKHPCGHCIKSRARCVPATQVSRPRRRRYTERELLEHLRKYEELLCQNNIKFEPLHRNLAGEKDSPNVEGSYDSENEQLSTARRNDVSVSIASNSERVYNSKNIRHSISQEFRDTNNNSESSDDDVRAVVFKNIWDQAFENDDHLLFGSRKIAIDIHSLHPEPVQIFRLWQLYLENVNPLLKVTHTPSLQGRLIEAAGNVLNVTPALEALMFSIYCISILSITVDDCQAMFGSSKADLLTKYQFGCQQALLNCGFLRCDDCDCLTALFIYLVSVRPSTVPASLSSMLGVAIRIAQRMGIHSESVLVKFSILEAEMRRRLWWSLILFDTRIGEMADFKTATLTPIWDCRIPLNVNDSDFRLGMKEPPQIQGQSTEAIFTVVRSDLGDFVRHTMFHIGLSQPAFKPVPKDSQHIPAIKGSELVNLDKTIEDKYLKFCDPENPLHFMTIWTTRAYIAKCRLKEHRFRYSGSVLNQAEVQRDAAISYALSMLECDTKIVASPLTKGFLWLANCHFPFIAYIHIIRDLEWRPFNNQREHAWEVMSENYQARFGFLGKEDNVFFKSFAEIILQAWEACEAKFKQSEEPLVIPRMVLSIRHKLAHMALNHVSGQSHSATDIGVTELSMPMPLDFDSNSLLYSLGGEDSYTATGPEAYSNMPELAPLNVNARQLDWSAMDWSAVDWGLINAPTD